MKTNQNSAKATNGFQQLASKSIMQWFNLKSIFIVMFFGMASNYKAAAKPFTGYEFQSATSITVAANKNVYVTGFKNLIDNNTEIVTQQYNATGKLINEVTNCNPDHEMHNDQPFKILSDKYSNVYVCGHEYIDDQYGYEVVLIKYNSNLDLQWKYVLYNSKYFADEARGIAFDGFENIIITGMQRQYEGRSKVFLYKISSKGELIYRADMPDDYDNKIESVNGLIADSLGSVYICGAANNKIKSKRFYTASFDAIGSMNWKRFSDCTNENYNDEAKSLTFDKWGNIIVTGSGELDNRNSATMVVKYNPAGILNWCKVFRNHNSGHETGLNVVADKAGNIYVVAGYSTMKISEQQFTVYKINNWGAQQWARNIAGAYTDMKICYDSLLYLSGNINANAAMIYVLSATYGIKKSISTYLPAKLSNNQNVSANFMALGSNNNGDVIVACGNTESCGETSFCESNWLVSYFSKGDNSLNKTINNGKLSALLQ